MCSADERKKTLRNKFDSGRFSNTKNYSAVLGQLFSAKKNSRKPTGSLLLTFRQVFSFSGQLIVSVGSLLLSNCCRLYTEILQRGTCWSRNAISRTEVTLPKLETLDWQKM